MYTDYIKNWLILQNWNKPTSGYAKESWKQNKTKQNPQNFTKNKKNNLTTNMRKVKYVIEESRENYQTIQVVPKSNPLWLYSGSEKQI